MQRNHWFANSDVSFQSVTNDLLHGQFAMQMYALHQVDVTSEDHPDVFIIVMYNYDFLLSIMASKTSLVATY